MSSSQALPPLHIRYKGLMDFQEAWKVIQEWLDSKGFEVIENKAKHRIAPFGEELETMFTAWRNVTDNYRFIITVYHKHWDGEYVDVVKDGKKKKMLRARYFFRVSGTVVTDYSDRFGKSKAAMHLGKFMQKYVTKWEWEVIYVDQLWYKLHELNNVIKDYLGMETAGTEFADMW